MNLDYKNISIGFVSGIICTIITFLFMGDVEVETDIQFGDNTESKNISIIIEKNVNQEREKIVSINVIGRGDVTMSDIENELERLCADQQIDTLEEIEVNITLDEGINFEQ